MKLKKARIKNNNAVVSISDIIDNEDYLIIFIDGDNNIYDMLTIQGKFLKLRGKNYITYTALKKLVQVLKQSGEQITNYTIQINKV